MFGIFEALNFARKIVETVTNTIMQQLRIVEAAAQQPIQGFMQEILGGAWEGDDADAFVGEIQSEVLPLLAELLSAIGGCNISLGGAIDAIDRADQKAAGIFEDLIGSFKLV